MELWINLSMFGYSNHSVSSLGRVKNNKRGSILKGNLSKRTGYNSVVLINDNGKRCGEYVHRLVLMAFKGNPPYPNITADHINKLDPITPLRI